MMKKITLILLFSAFLSGATAQSWNVTGNSASSSHFLGTTNQSPLIFKTEDVERMRLNFCGSFLGIGSKDPDATLHLHHQLDDFDHCFECGEDPGGGMGKFFSGNKLLHLTTPSTGIGYSKGFSVFIGSNKDLLFKQHENAKFYIEGPGGGLTIAPDGNVGIGTEVPGVKLDVSGSFQAQNANITGNLSITGNVGIGISNHPTIKLDVNGTIRSQEIKVCLNQGCDFVFEEDYRLMSLEELDSFIKTNKHLPDVAPAAIMEDEGINVSEMSAKLLQKIEELTLYILQQEKKMADLQNQINELKKQ